MTNHLFGYSLPKIFITSLVTFLYWKIYFLPDISFRELVKRKAKVIFDILVPFYFNGIIYDFVKTKKLLHLILTTGVVLNWDYCQFLSFVFACLITLIDSLNCIIKLIIRNVLLLINIDYPMIFLKVESEMNFKICFLWTIRFYYRLKSQKGYGKLYRNYDTKCNNSYLRKYTHYSRKITFYQKNLKQIIRI